MKNIYHQVAYLKRKYLTILFFFHLGIFSTYAQLPDSITVIREKPEKLLKNLRIQNITTGGFNFWYDDFSGHWAGLDFGFNTLLDKRLETHIPPFLEHDIFRSNSLYANIIQQSIGLQKTRNTIGLVTGLGLQFKSYRLNKNTTIEQNADGTVRGRTLVFDDNQKSKFSAVYLTAPLLLEFQIPINHYANRIFISGGMVGAYRLSSHTKIKYRSDRNKEKLKTPGDYGLQDFRYGVMMRLGYRQYQVFVNYDLVPMFSQEARVQDVYPFTFGVTLLSF